MKERMRALAGSVRKSEPMFIVRDMRSTVAWYESIGFTVEETFEDGGQLVFARLSFGSSEFALSPGTAAGPRDVRLWFFTDRVQELYEVFKQRELATDANDSSGNRPVRFAEELYEPFYGGRQFSIRDHNDVALVFWQPA